MILFPNRFVEVESIVAIGIDWISGVLAAAKLTAAAAVAVCEKDEHFIADGIIHNVGLEIVPHDGEEGCNKCVSEEESIRSIQ